jgi:creatinine amidohydrolase
MPWTEVRERIAEGATAIVSLGSIEEHGPHCPGGDYIIGDEIAARAAEITGDIVTPTLPFGYSEYFRNYPGTITLRSETLAAVMTDMIDSLLLHKFQRVAIFNGHAGNAPTVEIVARRYRRTHGLVIPSIAPFQIIQAPDLIERVYGGKVDLGHGGEPIGSLMMYLRPTHVQLHRAGAFGRRKVLGCPSEGLGAISVNGVRVAVPLDMEDVTPPTGSLSDPTMGNAERGRQLLDYAVQACAGFLRWFRTVNPRLGSGAGVGDGAAP